MGMVCSYMRDKPQNDTEQSYQHRIISPEKPLSKIQKVQQLQELLRDQKQGVITINGQSFQLDLLLEQDIFQQPQIQDEEVKKEVKLDQRVQSKPQLEIGNLVIDQERERKQNHVRFNDIQVEEFKKSNDPEIKNSTSHNLSLTQYKSSMPVNKTPATRQFSNMGLKPKLTINLGNRNNYQKKDTGRNTNSLKTNQVKLHFAYLFASPLVIKIDQVYEDILDEISFKDEFMGIQQALQTDQTLIKYRYQLATIQNLRDCLRQEPIGIHFSGHGLQNDKQVLKNLASIKYLKEIENQGDILVFENQKSGSSFFLFEKQLSKLLVLHMKKELQFVVVASCHSQKCGEIFKKAGAKHVICVQKEKQLNDNAAVVFSSIFYSQVFHPDQTYSICEAFKTAYETVVQDIGLEEASILRLLTTDNIDMKKLLQNGEFCSLCQQQNGGLNLEFQQGTLVSAIKQPQLLILPSLVTPWLSRDLDTYQTIEKLIFESARIVEVFGMPGVGKSALISKVVNYIADRNLYPGGIVYLNCQGISKVRELLSLFIQKVEYHHDQTFKRMQSLKGMKSKEIMTKLFSYTRSAEKMLFVFDNIDELVLGEEIKLRNTFKMFINEHQNLQLLFSSSKFMGNLDLFVVKNLKSLSIQKARDLFIMKIPSNEARDQFFSLSTLEKLHQISNEDENIDLLNKRLALNTKALIAFNTYKICKPCKIKGHGGIVEKCVKAYYEKHPLFMILNEPFSICLAASQLHSSSIVEIYKRLISHNDFTNKDDALVISIESVFEMLMNKSEFAFDMLILIGLSPQGLAEDDLFELFKQKDDQLEKMQDLIKSMVETSLIMKDEETNTYKVQNTIHHFIESRIKDNVEAKGSYYRMLAARYTDILIQAKKHAQENEIEITELIERCESYDKNIVSCLNFLIDLKFQQKKQEPNSPSYSNQQLVDQNIIIRQLTTQLARQITKKLDGGKKRKGFAKNKQMSQNKLELVSLVADKTVQKMQTIGGINKYESNFQNDELENKYDVDVQLDRIKEENKEKRELQFDDITINKNPNSQISTRTLNQPNVLVSKFTEQLKNNILEKVEKQQELDQSNDSINSPLSGRTEDFKFSRKDLNNSRDADSIVRNVIGNPQLNNSKDNFKLESDDSITSKQLDNGDRQGRQFDMLVGMIATQLQKKIKKMSDDVTASDLQKYDQTLKKFKMFDRFIIQKPSKVVQNFRQNNPNRGWTRRFSKWNGTSKKNNPDKDIQILDQDKLGDSLQVNSKAKNVNRQPSNSLQIQTQNAKKRQSTMLNSKKQFDQNDDDDFQMHLVSHEQRKTVHNPQLNLNAFKSQYESNQKLNQFQLANQNNQDNQNNQTLETEENDQEYLSNSDDQEENLSEGYILLYHYLSIQALKSDEKSDLYHLTVKFRVQDMDPIFRSNIDLLLVYQYFKLNRVGLIAPELENIRKVFQQEKCIQGEAVTSLFLGYFYANLKIRQNDTENLKKSFRFIYKGFKLFNKTNDKEGLIHCNRLKRLVDHKMNNVMRDEMNKISTQNTHKRSDSQNSLNWNQTSTTLGFDQMLQEMDKIKEGDGLYQKKRFKILKDEEIFNFLINEVDLTKKH
ncbi:UNKNOWN [Stylonychia lemnae]|uniref:NB-ARC domain-containing protein n=1 Tax=Stylonychia lemnae TaxID=5949 RepID=A0A078B108_STYLE|nr:UNKNOWN [Stylonychia lemnae]|eukprot:CDW87037.1 UNKNOWN [Stylonychia lemnae]